MRDLSWQLSALPKSARSEVEDLFDNFMEDQYGQIEDAFYQAIRYELRDYLAETESLESVDIDIVEDTVGKLANVAFEEYAEAFYRERE